jgi:spermidine/putrescine transport system substrate-binding protein
LEAAAATDDVPEELIKKVREEGGRLNVINWAEYIDKGRVQAFEKEFGMKVTYDAVANDEIMKTKIAAGKSGYDVVFPDHVTFVEMRELGLLQPLNHDWVPNMAGMTDVYVNPSWDPGNKYTVGYNWATTGHAYNKDKITSNDPRFGSHAILFEGKEFANRIGMLKYANNLIGAALKFLGYSVNTGEPWRESDKQKLMEVKEVLLKQKPLLAGYFTSTQIKEGLASNDLWVAGYYNGGSMMAARRNEKVGFYLPKEGDIMYGMPMCIVGDAPHPAAAHLWLNYILRPQIQAAIAEYTMYAPAVKAAKDFLPSALQQSKAMFPDEATIEKMEYMVPYTGKNKETRRQVFEEVMM